MVFKQPLHYMYQYFLSEYLFPFWRDLSNEMRYYTVSGQWMEHRSKANWAFLAK